MILSWRRDSLLGHWFALFLQNSVIVYFSPIIRQCSYFCKIIDDLGLFENAQVEDPSLKSDNIKLTGFLHISHKKFTELNTEKVKSLFDSGALEFIYAHFQSLVNLKNLD